MRSFRLAIVVSAAAITACQGPGGDSSSGSNIEEVTSALVGNVNQIDSAAWIPAVARLTMSYVNPSVGVSRCSGTMVASNKIITAAHCFCPSQGSQVAQATIDFAGANGIIPAGATTWVSTNIVTAPGAAV